MQDMKTDDDIKNNDTSIDILKYLPKDYAKKTQIILNDKLNKNEITKSYGLTYIYQNRSALEKILNNPDVNPRPSINIDVIEVFKDLALDNYNKLKKLRLL